MEKIYYTPQINEFFHGFEYEEFVSGYSYDFEKVKCDDGIIRARVLSEPKEVSYWAEKSFDFAEACHLEDDTINCNLSERIYEGKVRVKMLDAADCESLGWKKSNSSMFAEEKAIFEIMNPSGKYTLYEIVNGNMTYFLEIPECGRIVISYFNNDTPQVESKEVHLLLYSAKQIYNGICKSKSELKRLMSNLEIVE